MTGRLAKAKRLAGNLALLAVSLALVCGGVELALRLVAPQTLGLRYFSREGILLHYPGLSTVYRRGEFSSRVSINSEGLRDREYPPGKPRGVTRILVLGDSFTEGLQVDDEEVWPKLVERDLSGGEAGGGVELVNAALAGSGTSDQIRYLQVYGARWEPDWVLLAFYCGNDVRDNLSDRRAGMRDGRLWLTRRKPHGAIRHRVKTARYWLASRSHLYQFLRDRVDPSGAWKGLLRATGLREEKKTTTEEWEDFDDKRVILAEPPPEMVEGWELTLALLDRLHEETRALGARLAVVSIPSRWMVDRSFLLEKVESAEGLDPAVPGLRLETWAGRRGVPFADLYPRFVQRGIDRSYHFRTDAHWNPRGHRAAAEEIAAFLAPLLGGRAGP